MDIILVYISISKRIPLKCFLLRIYTPANTFLVIRIYQSYHNEVTD